MTSAASAHELQWIRSLPLFARLDPAIVGELAAAFVPRERAAGELVIQTGERPKALPVVQRGIVELCSVADHGDEVVVMLLSEQDLIIPAAAVLGEESLVCARALTPLKSFEIDVMLLRSAMARSPQLTFNVMKITSGQWRMAVRSILDLGTRSAAQRLASFLLRLADLQRESGSPVLPIAKRNLAARIGVAPETLSRTLQAVADNGLYLRGRAIIVRDRARIEEFCGPDPYPCKDERELGVFAL